jgi:glycosyltransferase involved in cell wall biosynthesis
VLAGAWQDDAISVLRTVATPNVNFTDWLEPQALAVLFQQASVYVQASLHEGFGLAVAEAMAAGCIPVVTRVGSLPEVVDDCGVYVEPEPQAIANGIQIALESSPDQRRRARDRILNQFPVSKRRAALWACVEQVMTHDRETNPA